jgi:hypothetical protein
VYIDTPPRKNVYGAAYREGGVQQCTWTPLCIYGASSVYIWRVSQGGRGAERGCGAATDERGVICPRQRGGEHTPLPVKHTLYNVSTYLTGRGVVIVDTPLSVKRTLSM